MKNQNHFFILAKEFINKYISKFNGKILGAILIGSASFGINDKFVDIDIFIYASDKVVKKRKTEKKGYNEIYRFKGIEVCVDWDSIEKLKEIVKNWKDDESLWSYIMQKYSMIQKG